MISPDYSIKQQYWPIHRFDKATERPDSFVDESAKPLCTDPLAILAYDLGEAHYGKFYRAIKDLPHAHDGRILDAWYMSGPVPGQRPLLPAELGSLLRHRVHVSLSLAITRRRNSAAEIARATAALRWYGR